MTKYKINLKEAPVKSSNDCPFGRNSDPDEYSFEYELNALITDFNFKIGDIHCYENDNDDKSIIVESKINSIKQLQEKMKPVFAEVICKIHYDTKNPMKIIQG